MAAQCTMSAVGAHSDMHPTICSSDCVLAQTCILRYASTTSLCPLRQASHLCEVAQLADDDALKLSDAQPLLLVAHGAVLCHPHEVLVREVEGDVGQI
eukprot:2078999-Rhodomonas_salina.1